MKGFLLWGSFVLMAGPSQALQVYPRVITPNGDGWNDKALFQLENPELLPLKGEVFDVNGGKVGDMVEGSNPDSSLLWDGRKSGAAVPGGVYIYRIEVGEAVMSGTVVVAQ